MLHRMETLARHIDKPDVTGLLLRTALRRFRQRHGTSLDTTSQTEENMTQEPTTRTNHTHKRPTWVETTLLWAHKHGFELSGPSSYMGKCTHDRHIPALARNRQERTELEQYCRKKKRFW